MKLIKLGISILLLINLTGCWSKVELDELTFVYGLFIDTGEEPGTVEITISTPLPNRLMTGQQSGSGSGDGKAYSTVSKTAANVPDAIRTIQKDLTRQLSLSHIKVIVVGREYAKLGIGELLEWIKREPSFPLGTFVVASPGRAKAVTRLTPIFEQLPSQVLKNFASDHYMMNTTVKDCLFAEASGMGFALTYLSFGKKSETAEQGKPEYWAGIQGAMLFRDNQMKGILQTKEGESLAWAKGQLKFPVYTLPLNEGKGNISALFVSDKSAKSVTMSSKGPVFHVKLKGTASITYIKNPQNINAIMLNREIIDALEKRVVADVSKALKATQEAGTDILYLGMLLEWNYPDEWRKLRDQWADYYAHEADIEVTADFNIDDFGSEK